MPNKNTLANANEVQSRVEALSSGKMKRAPNMQMWRGKIQAMPEYIKNRIYYLNKNQ